MSCVLSDQPSHKAIWVKQQSVVQWKKYIGHKRDHQAQVSCMNRWPGSSITHSVAPISLPQLTSMVSCSSLQPVVRHGKILGLAYSRVSLICWCELKYIAAAPWFCSSMSLNPGGESKSFQWAELQERQLVIHFVERKKGYAHIPSLRQCLAGLL